MSDEVVDAVIVGAGFAGLAAAKVLSALGFRSVVVDARSYVGGRARTKVFPAVPERGLEAAPVEEGCNYLHGCCREHPLFVLAAKVGVPSAVCPADLGGQMSGWESMEIAEWRDADAGGQRIPTRDVLETLFLVNQTVNGAAYFAESLVPRCSGAATRAEEVGHENMESLFDIALSSVLDAQVKAGLRKEPLLTARERGMFYSMRGRLIGYVSPLRRMPAWLASAMGGALSEKIFRDPHWPHSAPVHYANLENAVGRKLAMVRDFGIGPPVECLEEPDSIGEDRLLLGDGFKALVDAIADGLEVRLGERVTAVHHGSNVEVHLESGQTISAGFAVVTAPAGVLAGLDERSRITFEPPMPPNKSAAFRRLAIPVGGASTHEKVVMRWDPQEPFVQQVLGASGASLQFGTTDPRFHFLNLHRFGRQGQLLCHIWADAEWRDHELLSDDAVVLAVVAALRSMFPPPGQQQEDSEDRLWIAAPLQFSVTRWAQDPFALGAYSEIQSPDATCDDREICGATEGTVLFAGEATISGHVGAQCTHGALLSGAAAALKLYHRVAPLVPGESAEEHRKAQVAASLFSGDGPLDLNVDTLVDVLLGGNSAEQAYKT